MDLQVFVFTRRLSQKNVRLIEVVDRPNPLTAKDVTIEGDVCRQTVPTHFPAGELWMGKKEANTNKN